LRNDEIVFEEDSTLDLKNRVLLINSKNRTFSSFILCSEETKFSVCPDNPDWTDFWQDGRVHASSYCGPLRGGIERLIGPSFYKTGNEAVVLLDEVLRNRYGAGL